MRMDQVDDEMIEGIVKADHHLVQNIVDSDYDKAIIMDIAWNAINNLGISQSLSDGAL
jgi:hypothetical protein